MWITNHTDPALNPGSDTYLQCNLGVYFLICKTETSPSTSTGVERANQIYKTLSLTQWLVYGRHSNVNSLSPFINLSPK